MTGFLASVADEGEMELARAAGADIVDLKDPTRGALGAWEPSRLRAAVRRWRSWAEPRPMLSATIGDHPLETATLADAVLRIAETGVPIVKLGMFAAPRPAEAIAALGAIARHTRLVAVFLADRQPDFTLLDVLAKAGFFAAMLDTADKAGGGLRAYLPEAGLTHFLKQAREAGLATGLAGQLSRADIGPLAALRPDYLGFRGALCRQGRTGRLDPEAARAVRAMIDAASAAHGCPTATLPARIAGLSR